MVNASEPFIAGAGPVGLAAGVFLARAGVNARIIELATEPSRYSKALAVNPRTLEILEPSGITKEMLAIGKPIHGARFWRHDAVLGEVLFEKLHHTYPYMLALSQAVAARLLESHLNQLGVRVERGVKLVGCAAEDDAVQVSIESAAGSAQSAKVPWLCAADGAHSAARESLGIEFQGDTFAQPWHLVDVPLKTKLAENFAHIVFLDGGGFRFLIRVVDDTAPPGDPLWRVMGDGADLLGPPPQIEATGPAVWTSKFNIAHRINERMQQGQVYFAGDAAHVHSPVGARGMNLGIEDAWVFAELLKQNRLHEYGQLRHKVDGRVVRRIEVLSRLARGESIIARILRATALPVMTHVPITRNQMMEMVTGLDHPLEP